MTDVSIEFVDEDAEIEKSTVNRIAESLDLNLDKAVAQINDICRKQIDPGREILGTYLLDVVYYGDTKAAQSRNPQKEISIQKICRHAGLEADPKRLQESLQVAIFRREAEKKEIDVSILSFTKVLHISRAKSREKAFSLAKEAIEHNYSVTEIKEKLREEQPTRKREKQILQFLRNYKSQDNDDNKEIINILKDKGRLRSELETSARDNIKAETTKIRQSMEAHLKLVRSLEKTLIEILSDQISPSQS